MVVDLPEPAGPVIRIRPRRSSARRPTTAGRLSASREGISGARARIATWGRDRPWSRVSRKRPRSGYVRGTLNPPTSDRRSQWADEVSRRPSSSRSSRATGGHSSKGERRPWIRRMGRDPGRRWKSEGWRDAAARSRPSRSITPQRYHADAGKPARSLWGLVADEKHVRIWEKVDHEVPVDPEADPLQEGL